MSQNACRGKSECSQLFSHGSHTLKVRLSHWTGCSQICLLPSKLSAVIKIKHIKTTGANSLDGCSYYCPVTVGSQYLLSCVSLFTVFLCMFCFFLSYAYFQARAKNDIQNTNRCLLSHTVDNETGVGKCLYSKYSKHHTDFKLISQTFGKHLFINTSSSCSNIVIHLELCSCQSGKC